jgi:hypothetical protein
MNKLPGIQTTNSCCGHADKPKENIPHVYENERRAYWIFFHPKSFTAMLPLLYLIQKCHSPVTGAWRVEVYTDCAGDRTFFLLEGPSGVEAYKDSEIIAEQLESVVAKRMR